MNILNPMVESIMEPGLAMLERFDELEGMAGSHSMGNNIWDNAWEECNHVTQSLLETRGLYWRFALSLWEAVTLQLMNHIGPIEDLSRTTIALLKVANYDASGAGPVIGGLNRETLNQINVFNSQDVTYAQVKPYLVEFAEWHRRAEYYADAFRRARYHDAMDAYRRG